MTINSKFKREMPLHLMLVAPLILLLIYYYWPMFGIVMAFQDFVPSLGFFRSKFVGLDNFKYILSMNDTFKILWNTFFIAILKIIFKTGVPFIFALLLNECSKGWFKKSVQTVTFFPYFLSWVVLSGILLDFFSPTTGLMNEFLKGIGIKEIFFFGEPKLFPYMIVFTDVWKNIGYNTIIFLAAIAGIDPTVYEAAIVDGANRFKQVIHVTIPAITGMLLLVLILSMGNILNAGFDQVFNLYTPLVYSTGDILDTFVYRTALLNGQMNIGAAVGVFRSIVSFVIMVLSYTIANKFTNYRVF